MTTNSMRPVRLSVTFAEFCGCHADLHLSADSDPSLVIAVTHERVTGSAATYSVPGNGNVDDITVQDNETLLIIARNDHSEIIACALYEVNLDLIELRREVLRPCVTSNLTVKQGPQSSADRLLAEACAAVTGALIAEEVAR